VAKRKMKKEWVFEDVAVECYSGYKGEETPRAFIYQNRRFEILEVLDRWYEGGMDSSGVAHNYFKAKTPDGEIFLLRYTPRFQSWTLCRQVPAPHFSDN
jgi:hypothetical protein